MITFTHLFYVECTIKFTGVNMENDYKVADMSLADFGRREISLQKMKCQL